MDMPDSRIHATLFAAFVVDFTGRFVMDSGEIFARITQMREAAATIGRSAARVGDCIEAIDNEVRAIGPDRFMSIGAEAFRVEYNRLTPRLREAFDNLLRFQDKLTASADDIEVASRSKM